jgi:hypothetical protein
MYTCFVPVKAVLKVRAICNVVLLPAPVTLTPFPANEHWLFWRVVVLPSVVEFHVWNWLMLGAADMTHVETSAPLHGPTLFEFNP